MEKEKYLTCPYCGKSGYKNLPSHTRQSHGKNLEALLEDFPDIQYEHPEYVKNRLTSMRETCKKPEFKEKMSKIRKDYFEKNPEMKEFYSKKIINQMETGNIKSMSGWEGLKNHIENDKEFANKISKIRSNNLKHRWENNRELMMSDIMKGWTDEIRERQSEITTNYLMSIKNKDITTLTEKQKEMWFSEKINILFRSSWEKQLAEFLYDKSIEFEYENYKFKYDKTHNYIVDFYLPKYNLFIEVKPIVMIDQIVIDKLNAVIEEGKKIILFTENELQDIDSFINKIVEGKLHELLETREGYIATAQLAITNATA